MDVFGFSMVKTTKKDFEHFYPYDYGQLCKKHAEPGNFACQGNASAGEVADWCADPWCYVDPCTCGIGAMCFLSFILTFN